MEQQIARLPGYQVENHPFLDLQSAFFQRKKQAHLTHRNHLVPTARRARCDWPVQQRMDLLVELTGSVFKGRVTLRIAREDWGTLGSIREDQ